MKLYIYSIVFFVFTSLLSTQIAAQGCVAVRNMSSCGTGHDSTQTKGFQLSLNYRYFRSYKHFRGKHEEKHRVEQGTEVINNDNSILLGVLYAFNSKWSGSVTLPYLFIDRSSLYEHYGNPSTENPVINPRFHTQAQGLGDVRVSGYYNVINNKRLTLAAGLGMKLPTGNYQVKDHFHKKAKSGDDSLVYKVVDQSIQLGDGGFGITTEFDFSYAFHSGFGLYASGLYLLNPRNTNGIERSSTLTGGIPLSNEFSVADQYLLRFGGRYNYSRFQFNFGGRYEGIASEDIIGKSDGWRRPGYIISAEPSVIYNRGQHAFGVNFPVAIERNRVQNTIDKERTKASGTFTIGDAAFADWLLSVSYTYKLAK